MILTMLSMPSGWELTFGAINSYYDGLYPSHLITIGIMRGRGLVIDTFKTNKLRTIHGLITYGCTLGALMFHLKY